MRGYDAWWYFLGGAIIIAGLVASIFGGIRDYRALMNALTSGARFVVPGSVELAVTKPGTYLINYEYRSVVGGEIFSTAPETDIKCTAKRLQGGEDITIEPASFSMQYEIGGRAGKTIAQFNAPQPGRYALSCTHGDTGGQRIAVAVSLPVGGDFLISLLKWVAIAFGSLATGLIIFIVTLVRRAATLSRSRPTP